jgi:four helix bundle protein
MVMAGFRRFEDIEAWQEARKLSALIYSMTKRGDFSRDFGLKDQIRRASVSVMSNIAEGFDRGGNKEFIQFLYIAKGSAAEVKAQLYVALDAGYITKDMFQKIYNQANATAKLIGGFIRYLAATDYKGTKFKL